MKRPLLRTSAFVRAAKRAIRTNRNLAGDIHSALKLLEEDAFHPALRTHKLKGRLASSWACSAGYDLRIVFSFVEHKGAEAILLETVGTHEDCTDPEGSWNVLERDVAQVCPFHSRHFSPPFPVPALLFCQSASPQAGGAGEAPRISQGSGGPGTRSGHSPRRRRPS
jgi:mRNA-degrading endonuclease YafQ of YafQ-DinJ toxin-antitoxin module